MTSLKRENMWIALVWVFIFMVVLVWDQEKIVVLNLILFCYFLYYMVGSSLSDNLNQKANLVRVALAQDIALNLDNLSLVLNQSKNFVLNFSNIIRSLLKKADAAVIKLLVNQTNSKATLAAASLFASASLLLAVYSSQTDILVSQRYLFTSNSIQSAYNAQLVQEQSSSTGS